MRTFAIANQKGGVGKSTTTYNLAAALVDLGHRVLVVDADPQGNLTSVITTQVERDDVGVADVMSSRTDIEARDALAAGIWDGLDVLPTPNGRNLRIVGEELVIAGPGRERRLAEALETIRDRYDVCLIDCPPSLDQLMINALTAAQEVLIVGQARLWSSDGLAQLLETIDEVRRYYSPTLHVAGVLVNAYEERQIGARHWLEELTANQEATGITVLRPVIPKRVVIADAIEASTTLADWGEHDLSNLYREHATRLLNGAA